MHSALDSPNDAPSSTSVVAPPESACTMGEVPGEDAEDVIGCWTWAPKDNVTWGGMMRSVSESERAVTKLPVRSEPASS